MMRKLVTLAILQLVCGCATAPHAVDVTGLIENPEPEIYAVYQCPNHIKIYSDDTCSQGRVEWIGEWWVEVRGPNVDCAEFDDLFGQGWDSKCFEIQYQ